MKEKKKTFEIELPHTDGIKAFLELEAKGQQDPKDGDNVIVRGALSFPVDPYPYNEIPTLLCFKDRVHLLNIPLGEYWGVWSKNKNKRGHSVYVNAPTWKEAFDKTEHMLKKDLGELINALERRYQALVDAEKED